MGLSRKTKKAQLAFQKRKTETPSEREERRRKDRENRKRYYARLSPSSRQKFNNESVIRRRIRQARESSAQREERRRREAIIQAQRRMCESPTARNQRLSKKREYIRIKRKLARLEKIEFIVPHSAPFEQINIKDESEKNLSAQADLLHSTQNLAIGTIVPSTSNCLSYSISPKLTTPVFTKQEDFSEADPLYILPPSSEKQIVLINLENTENNIKFEAIKTEVQDFEEIINTEEVTIKTELQQPE